jgi:hypothetical protein
LMTGNDLSTFLVVMKLREWKYEIEFIISCRKIFFR